MGNVCGCIEVEESSLAIVERFGKYRSTLKRGYYLRPKSLGYRVAGIVSLRVQRMDVKCKVTTKDNMSLNTVVSMLYCLNVDKAFDAFYKVRNPRNYIQIYLIQAITVYIAKLNFNEALEQTKEVPIRDELNEILSQIGYNILGVQITDIQPNERVKRLMDENYAGTIKAEAENRIRIEKCEVEGHLQRESALSEARRNDALARAHGNAAQANDVGRSVILLLDSLPGINAKDVMDMVLASERADAIKKVSATSNASIISGATQIHGRPQSSTRQ